MLGRIAYAVAFCVALPALLVLWAVRLDQIVELPIVHSNWAGGLAAAAGAALMAWAMIQLRTEAGGLPMNAFPPQKRAVGGPFAWLDHPIYTGFVLACAGIAVWRGSPSGFWIVTPLAAAGCAALVWGYEGDAILRQLGPRNTPPRIRLAAPDDRPPDLWDRLSIAPLIFLPWLICYMSIGHLPVPGAIDARLAFERGWPVVEWTEWIYASVYPLVIVAPTIVRTKRELRRFARLAIGAMVLAFWCYLVIPLISPPRWFVARSWAGVLLEIERIDGLDGRAAFPSFHVCWAMIAAWAWGTRGTPARVGAFALAIAISASCITTGMHAIADVVAGMLLFAVVWCLPAIWNAAIAFAEHIAGGWREWRIGPVRVLIHGVYAGFAAGIAALVARSFAGEEARWAILGVAIGGLVGAGTWGQLLARGSGLARPFGYFGHLAGCGIAIGVVAASGGEAWLTAAALAACAPFAQAIGRLRCLVQGCCHGRPIDSGGIRYTDERSRVCRYTELRGRVVHATPVYSIIGNILIAGLLLRLWTVGAPASFIVGAYLIMQGLARFVEEHYRGEPRTPVIAGLRLYQWLAAVCVLAGACVTVMQSEAVRWPRDAAPSVLIDAVVLGVVYAIAMGVDFPQSRRRFGRLA
jgi:prolipoprotein diacylglyceryltransferase/protein-S-isoprenylcysteine O-methyltransferase Ste14